MTTGLHASRLKAFKWQRQTTGPWRNHSFNSLHLNNRGTLSGQARTKEHALLLCRKFPSWATIGQFYIKAGLAWEHCFSIGWKKRQSSSGFFLYHSASYVFYYETELKVSPPQVEWFSAEQQSLGDCKVLILMSLDRLESILTDLELLNLQEWTENRHWQDWSWLFEPVGDTQQKGHVLFLKRTSFYSSSESALTRLVLRTVETDKHLHCRKSQAGADFVGPVLSFQEGNNF